MCFGCITGHKPDIEFQYRGKTYRMSFWGLSEWSKKGGKILPVDEEEIRPRPKNSTNEIVVKNYQKGFWKNTIEANGETIAVKGWGAGKHFVIWGSAFFFFVLLPVIIIYLIRRHRSRLKEEEWKKMVREVRKHSS